MMPCLANILWGVTNPWAIGGVVLLGLFCIFWVFWIYRGQGPAVRRFWIWLMMGLRAAALVAIVLVILRPSAVRPERADEAGAVAILIDCSKSMSAIDTGDPPARQVAVADALGLLPPAIRPVESVQLLQQLEKLILLLDQTQRAKSELQYAELTDNGVSRARSRFNELTEKLKTGEAQLPASVVLPKSLPPSGDSNFLTDTRAAMERLIAQATAAQHRQDQDLFNTNPDVRNTCLKLSAMSRLARARLAVRQFVQQLPPKVPIYGFLFGAHLAPVALRQNGQLAWPTTAPAERATDLTGSLREVSARTGGRPVRAIVVFTDGRQIGEPVGALPEPHKTPIFPVLCAGALRDLVLADISSPLAAYPGEPIPLRINVESAGLHSLPLIVRSQAGQTTYSQNFWLNPRGTAGLVIPISIDHPGDHQILAEVEPQTGEASFENNKLKCRINIGPAKLAVALLTDSPNWDFQYLHSILESTPWIHPQVALASTLQQISADQLRQQDVIILDNLSATQLNPAQLQAIHDLVEKNGGTLLLIAGGSHVLSDDLNDRRFANLLPFTPADPPVWRAWAGEDAFFRFAPADGDLAVLRLEDEPSNLDHQWSRLPAMYHYLQMPRLKPGVRTLLTERESGSPVMTESRQGNGRVILVGFDETWRWRINGGAKIQRRFWTQLLRHAGKLSDTIETKRTTGETADLAPDPALLERISENTGGQLLTLTDSDQIWNKIQQYQQTHPGVVEYPLWHSPWLFAFILGCLGAEWGLRKRFGLA